jgi:hypothetical protein
MESPKHRKIEFSLSERDHRHLTRSTLPPRRGTRCTIQIPPAEHPRTGGETLERFVGAGTKPEGVTTFATGVVGVDGGRERLFGWLTNAGRLWEIIIDPPSQIGHFLPAMALNAHYPAPLLSQTPSFRQEEGPKDKRRCSQRFAARPSNSISPCSRKMRKSFKRE